MTSTPATSSLESWFHTHGGYLHPDIRILQASPDSTSGIHYHATAPIPPGTTFAHAPHSLALSYLSALVDDTFPVFKQHRHRFKVEAIGFWYLMMQYVNLEESFWKPYLATLPAPGSEFTQPLFFLEREDVAWLEGTDVWYTALARKEVYERYYRDGLDVLREAGVDVEPYTWDLFKWAVTIFSSRSFASRALHPESSKYWTTYKSTTTRSRESVLLDMSSVLAEDLVFPVLFPGLDAANHDHDARVEWTYDPGRFSLTLAESGVGVEAGNEVLNNYGPKGNGELLLGYGFCIPNNPHDTVAMTLKPPSPSLQGRLKSTHPDYFTKAGAWSTEKTTFYLKRPPAQVEYPEEIFAHLPEPLIGLLYILLHDRNPPFAFTEPQDHPTSTPSRRRRYTPHLARMLTDSLTHKLHTLQTSTPPSTPQNAKQTHASLYRASQLSILTALLTALQHYTTSLIMPSPPPTHPTSTHLLTLQTFHSLLSQHSILGPDFLRGLAASTNSNDLTTLCNAGWEEDLWVLLLCYTLLSPQLADAGKGWLRGALRDYLLLLDGGTDLEGVVDGENARELLGFVRKAAEVCGGGSVWADGRWGVEFVAAVGGLALGRDGFWIRTHLAEDGGEGGWGMRCYLCLDFGKSEGEE